MSFTAWFPSIENKEFFTAKTDSGYIGCIKTDKCIVLTKEVYDKPLVAANAARKLNKTLKQDGAIKEVCTGPTIPGSIYARKRFHRAARRRRRRSPFKLIFKVFGGRHGSESLVLNVFYK